MKGIIIDGVASSGKTMIFQLLQKKLVEFKPSTTKLFISEHYTQRMIEHLRDDGSLNGGDIKKHIEKIITVLSEFQNMLEASKFNNQQANADSIVVLERFILTHFVSQKNEDDFSIDDAKIYFTKLKNFNIKQILLIIPQNKIRERIMSTLNYRNDAWKEYLLSKGSEDQIIEEYIKWQEKCIKYAGIFKDFIDTEVIEVKENDYDNYVEKILKSLT
ncbi:MAG: hypothetical protein WCV92_00335 [Candidatus Buchananbacteria bacterium]